MKAILSSHAKLDLLAGIDWFEDISNRLGDEFEAEFYAALERVKDGPRHFSVDHTGYRPCRLKRFVAVLYFRIAVELLVVVGLFTSGEDENALQRR